MKKAVSKRIKITKTGKLMRRKMAQDHFRAKKRGVQLHRKRGDRELTTIDSKIFLKYLTAKR